MTDWTEEDFLERLMPLMQQNDPANRGACPDVELLCAFSEDRITAAQKASIDTHLAGCARCRELHSRLVSFVTPAAREDEQEWTNAEKRLDNWMEGFLRSQEREHANARTQRALSDRANEGKWWSAWKAQWVFGAFAAAVLAVLAVFLLRPSPRVPHEVQTAQATLPAPPAPATKEASGVPQPAPSATSTSTASSPVADKSPAAKVLHPKAEEQHLPPPAAPKPAPRENTPQIVAEAVPPPPPPPSVPAETPSVTSTFAPENPSARPAGSSVATKMQGGTSNANANSLSLFAPATSRPAAYGSNTAHPAAPAASTANKLGVNLPAVVRLEAGTRLWIRISSLVRHPDGTLKFEGTLFEPVTQHGVVTLAQGTGVSGIEKLDQNSTLLVITGLNLGGMRYTLQGSAAMKDTVARGGGKALRFDAGQLLEMFVESDTVYEKSPAAAGQPAPQ